MRPGYRFRQGVVTPGALSSIVLPTSGGVWGNSLVILPPIALPALGAVRTRLATFTISDDAGSGLIKIRGLAIRLAAIYDVPPIDQAWQIDAASRAIPQSGTEPVLPSGIGLSTGLEPFMASQGYTVRLSRSTFYARDLIGAGSPGAQVSVGLQASFEYLNTSAGNEAVLPVFAWSYEIWQEPYQQ